MITNNPYQDIIKKDGTIIKGNRECNLRYKSIQPILARYDKFAPIKVLDFGANYGYFSLQILKDFPIADITMVDYEPILKEVYKEHKQFNLHLIHKFIELEDIEELAKNNKYDVVLALSVLHHFKEYKKVIDLFLEMGTIVIFEIGYPDEKPISNQWRVKPIHDYLMTKNPIQVNNWLQHDRPIYYVNSEEYNLKGTVKNGCGIASQKTFVEIEPQILNRFGQKLYPGTLNITLDNPVTFLNEEKLAQHYNIFPLFLFGLPLWNIRPDIRSYPTPHMELISPFSLRQFFNLKNNDTINMGINRAYLNNTTI
jgi:hypothetical protein